eukprot:gene17817-12767_t
MGDHELASTVEHSLALYLKDCQQQHQIITFATFDIASVLPNIALQELWRRTLPSQSSVNTRELALHIDTDLMRDESSLYLSPSSFGFPSSTTSLVDALIDILSTVGKSRREITIFEFARFTMGCEVYWTLAEVVTHWLQRHYADRGIRCLPALSQLTPYFIHQGHSLLLRDKQFKVLAEAVRSAPFTIVFGPKQIGKTFRLRHILDDEDWSPQYHTLWIDCAHVVGGEDLPMAMLAAMNAQLYLGQAHPESVLSDFSSLLHFWTKQCVDQATQQARTTCLVFDHVASSLLSALQPFATLIGSNACKLVMVLSDVETMDALQYTLSVEPTLVAMISEETRWLDRVWQPLVDKGLLRRYGVSSSMTMYPAGEEYTLSREAMLLFSIVVDAGDVSGEEEEERTGTGSASINQTASSCSVEHVMQQFITFWWEEWSTLTQELLQDHQEQTVALAWFGEHEELLRRLLHYLFREAAAAGAAPCASSTIQTLIQQSCFNATSFVVHMVMFRVDTSASYWHPSTPSSSSSAAAAASSAEKVTLSQRQAILCFAFDVGQRLFGLPPSLIAAEAVYDYLEALHAVLVAEVAQYPSSMTGDGGRLGESSSSSSRQRASSTRPRRTQARSLRVTVEQKNDWSPAQEAYWQFLQYLDAEVCLLLAKLTAAAIRI